MVKAKPGIHRAVQEHSEYKRKALYRCHLDGYGTVTAEQCRALSAHTANNLTCIETQCPSMWRACIKCIESGQVNKQFTLIDKTAGLCETHQAGQVQEDLKQAPFDSPVEADNQKLVPEANVKAGLSMMDKLLQQVMNTASEPTSVPVSAIRRFADQPRHEFDSESLRELGESLKVVQIYPVFLRRLTKEDLKEAEPGVKYELVDGERRWRACQVVHKEEVIAIFLDVPDKATQFAISAIANFGRKDHTPLEEAYALHFMREEFGMSMRDAVKMFAKSEPWGYARAKLLELDQRVLRFLTPSEGVKGVLKIGTAMLLAENLKDRPVMQYEAAEHFANHPHMSVAAAERHISHLMEREGVEQEKKERGRIVGSAKAARALRSLIDTTWTKVLQLHAVSADALVAMPLEGEERITARNNLHRLSVRIEELARKL